ncbi:hypothetical protein GQ53DRAFT_727476 [Thozetella sp. PMI_491]|nr:hypothetical protein GQ53DRAFT_727476 [Thozetella sp. PMI_491]
MAEPWYLLGLCKAKRVALAKQAQQIRQDCAKNHEKRHIVECEECYPKLLSAIRDRYLCSQDTEWFTGRRAFLKEIDTMFTEAMEYKFHPNKVEARIEDEKKKWMRESMKQLLNNIDDVLTKDALLDRLNDKDMSMEDLITDLDLAMGRDDPTSEEWLEEILDHLSSAKSGPERNQVCIESFLVEAKGQPVPADREKYVAMLNQGKTMDQVIEQAVVDQKAMESAQAKKKELEERLDFFRRAKTAHGAKKAKKAAAKQERENRAKNREKDREKERGRGQDTERQHPTVPPEFFKQPPCHACGGQVSLAQGLRCCAVCQLFAGWSVQESTVFCSEKCFHNPRKGKKAHARTHTCAAGAACVSLQDEDVDMDRQISLVFCKECVDSLKLPTVFCSINCYAANFQRHRERVHLPARERGGTTRDDENELVYDDSAKTRYRPRDVRGGVKAWYEAVTGWEAQFHAELGTI